MDGYCSNRRGFLGTAAAGAGAAFLGQAAAGGTEEQNRQGNVPLPYHYTMPAFPKGATILFQGDSITHGGRGGDPNHYMGHSYAYLIAARIGADVPERELNFLNRGVSGNTVNDLLARWQKDAIDLKPDVLSILIGVNDRSTYSVDDYRKTYTRLLEMTMSALPRVVLVLCDPFVNARETATSRARIEVDARRAVVKELAEAFKAIHVPTQDIYDEAARRGNPNYWIWDEVHPMPAGHELLARRWIEAVAAQLPTRPT